MANSASTTLSVIDGATNTVTTTIGGMANPFGVAVNPSTNTVYVTNFGASGSGTTVSVINGATNTITATVGVGMGPFGLAVNPSTNLIYVANTRSDTVSVINGATNTIAATISGLKRLHRASRSIRSRTPSM